MAANAGSLGENSRSLIFPGVYGIQQQIPLWMKFYCYEYSNIALGRTITSNAGMGGGNVQFASGLPIPALSAKEKAQIFLPAPVNFQTNTAHKYEAKDTTAQNLLPNTVGDLVQSLSSQLVNFGVPAGLIKFFSDAFGNINDGLSIVERRVGNLTGFESSLVNNDILDNVFQNTGPSRSYEIKFNLPCLTPQDSSKAAQIIQAFEALSLPTARSVFSIHTTKSFHPPLWIFGIGPIDQRRYDSDWTGSPQLCVLRSVSNKRTAYETNALAALGGGSLLKPVAYTLSLSFVELEPAYRAMTPSKETSLQIINRSTVITTSGQSGIAASAGI